MAQETRAASPARMTSIASIVLLVAPRARRSEPIYLPLDFGGPCVEAMGRSQRNILRFTGNEILHIIQDVGQRLKLRTLCTSEKNETTRLFNIVDRNRGRHGCAPASARFSLEA